MKSKITKPGKKNKPHSSTQRKMVPSPAENQQKVEKSVPERIAKRMARAGLCSRREAERWIEDGRVRVNGRKLDTPAFTVTNDDRIEVDGALIPGRERTRLWLYHKPQGLITTNKDPEGRRTVFQSLPESLPRVLSIGRLDINTEGLLLLTNDGGLARTLELPSTGWLRRYRVRVFGKVDQKQLADLADGIAVEGTLYGSIDAKLDRAEGANSWLTLAFREGKNREVKRVLGALGLEVNRLIRVSYGPFQLGELKSGEVREIRGRMLRDQLGEKLIGESQANFDAPILHHTPDITTKAGNSKKRSPSHGTKRKTPKGQVKQENLERLGTRPGNLKKKAADGSGRRSGKSKPSRARSKADKGSRQGRN